MRGWGDVRISFDLPLAFHWFVAFSSFSYCVVFISYCLILIKSQFVHFVCLNNDVNIVLHRNNLHCGLFPETFYYTASPVAV